MKFLITLCLSLFLTLSTTQTNAFGGNTMIKLTTTMGDIVLELDGVKAPITAANFEQYVKDGFFDGLIFHRVIDGFMIQGGGFEPNMNQKEGRNTIENEANNGLTNDKYTIAMARTSAPHSASSQFFINVNNNGFLNHTAPTAQGWGYAVFGRVTEGFEVVDAIAKVKTGFSGYHQDVPTEPVIITKAEIID